MNKYIVGIATLMIIVGLSTQASAAVTEADILFLVDESGSMGGAHTWLAGMITDLEAKLVSEGITNNNYGLVGFGSTLPLHDPSGGYYADAHKHTVGGSDWGTALEFATATGVLGVIGDNEDGWHAIDFGLNNYTFRPNAARNIVLVTDEDRDDDAATAYGLNYLDTLQLLKDNSAMLNVVVDIDLFDASSDIALGVDWEANAFLADGSGGYTATIGGGTASGGDGTTLADYVNLAWATEGAAWDLMQLQAGGFTATSFTAAFVDIKAGEIELQDPQDPEPGIPEPGSIVIWSLLGLTFVGASLRRRRRRA